MSFSSGPLLASAYLQIYAGSVSIPHSHPKEDAEFNLETQATRTSNGPVF